MGNVIGEELEDEFPAHKRRYAQTQEIFDEWNQIITKSSNLSKISLRQPILLPLEYNKLYFRRVKNK